MPTKPKVYHPGPGVTFEVYLSKGGKPQKKAARKRASKKTAKRRSVKKTAKRGKKATTRRRRANGQFARGRPAKGTGWASIATPAPVARGRGWMKINPDPAPLRLPPARSGVIVDAEFEEPPSRPRGRSVRTLLQLGPASFLQPTTPRPPKRRRKKGT